MWDVSESTKLWLPANLFRFTSVSINADVLFIMKPSGIPSTVPIVKLRLKWWFIISSSLSTRCWMNFFFMKALGNQLFSPAFNFSFFLTRALSSSVSARNTFTAPVICGLYPQRSERIPTATSSNGIYRKFAMWFSSTAHLTKSLDNPKPAPSQYKGNLGSGYVVYVTAHFKDLSRSGPSLYWGQWPQ